MLLPYSVCGCVSRLVCVILMSSISCPEHTASRETADYYDMYSTTDVGQLASSGGKSRHIKDVMIMHLIFLMKY